MQFIIIHQYFLPVKPSPGYFFTFPENIRLNFAITDRPLSACAWHTLNFNIIFLRRPIAFSNTTTYKIMKQTVPCLPAFYHTFSVNQSYRENTPHEKRSRRAVSLPGARICQTVAFRIRFFMRRRSPSILIESLRTCTLDSRWFITLTGISQIL